MSGTSPGPARAGRATRQSEAQALGPSLPAEHTRPKLRSSSLGTPRSRRRNSSESDEEMEKSLAEIRKQKQRNVQVARAQEVGSRRGAPTEKPPQEESKLNPALPPGKQGKKKEQKPECDPVCAENKQQQLQVTAVSELSKCTDTESKTLQKKETSDKPADKMHKFIAPQTHSDPPLSDPVMHMELESVAPGEGGVCVVELGESGKPSELTVAADLQSQHGESKMAPANTAQGVGGVGNDITKAPVSQTEPLTCAGAANVTAQSPGGDNVQEEQLVRKKGEEPTFKATVAKPSKGAIPCKGKIKGKDEPITAEEVAEALKELQTLQNEKKKLQISIKCLNNLVSFSDGKETELHRRKKDSLFDEMSSIDQRINQLYGKVGPWKEIYQNKQRFESMRSGYKAAYPHPATGRRQTRSSTSNSPATSESEPEFAKPLPPRRQQQRRGDRVNWQNMTFDEKEIQEQEKKKKEQKSFKVNLPQTSTRPKLRYEDSSQAAYEISSDQDFPELPKAAVRPSEDPSVRRRNQTEGKKVSHKAAESGPESEDKMEVAAQESLLCVQNEVAESVAESVAPVTDGNECEQMEVRESQAEEAEVRESAAEQTEVRESAVVQPEQENAAEESVTQEAGVEVEQVGHIESQSDQVQQRVEVESIQVGGVDETANSFWGKRRLFATPDVSHDNQPFKRKHWVKIKWDGEKEQVPSRRFLVRTVILDSMGFRPGDLSAVIAQTETDFDVTFKLQEALENFWRIYNMQKRAGNQNWEQFVVIPMTKPETKNITIVTKNDAIPQEDILIWLRRQCTVLTPLVKVFDEDGVWAGVWKTQVKLNITGNVPQHLPNSFFIGKERGTCFYAGQPRRCYKCGASNHLARSCAVLRCALCNAIGHVADACVNVRCNLCNRMGHVHRSCPEAYHNIVTLFPEIDKEMRKYFVTPERETSEESETEVRDSQSSTVPKKPVEKTVRTNRKENPKPDRKENPKPVREISGKAVRTSRKENPKPDRKENPKPDRKENPKPVREIREKAVRSNTNKEGKKDENGWQTVNTKNKTKMQADLLDPGEGSATSFLITTKNKFVVLEKESETWGDRTEREEQEELEKIEREEESELEQENTEEMEIQLPLKKRGREGSDQTVRKKGVGAKHSSDQDGESVCLEDGMRSRCGPQVKRYGEEAVGLGKKKHPHKHS
ncbi:uncharacterized protein LOC121400719 [Xenopus laevis]|uniref:Uncharacterized protein LOC121400719 n=1 Tax=Xenopus laevis TaxID=8355 RepID=A0A8J1MGM0_XENLA|nr:uncharacterized protein LOC121400719 [Xenopus laevis]